MKYIFRWFSVSRPLVIATMRWIPLLIAGLTVTKIRAANDWNKPCFNGTCSYIVGDGASKAFGTLLLRGDQNTISDIT